MIMKETKMSEMIEDDEIDLLIKALLQRRDLLKAVQKFSLYGKELRFRHVANGDVQIDGKDWDDMNKAIKALMVMNGVEDKA